MAELVTEPQFFESFDGARIAWHEIGEGRPVVLIHGLFSNAWTNWIRYGHAEAIAARGFRVIMPDLRAHGSSAAPHDLEAYPPDAPALDGLALLRHLDLRDYDLGGYSLGARTTVRMLVKGAAPRRVILAGMGLEGILDTQLRASHFRNILANLGQHARGTPEWLAEAFLKTTGGDPEALMQLLGTFVDTDRGQVEAIEQPVLVLAGAEDSDNGSHAALAELLQIAELREVPGSHMSAVTRPELGQAIADFLTA
ncbi:alpha/beta fold hydrolase [Sphingosinithalassobacter sp. LHW66-3]|uniref:alpha/beta fold hydrolase n=1 Tax=Sphingosinithalassobacter sp. LHW66-3 TaxID=3424718 RepID=UPI003D6B5A19